MRPVSRVSQVIAGLEVETQLSYKYTRPPSPRWGLRDEDLFSGSLLRPPYV